MYTPWKNCTRTRLIAAWCNCPIVANNLKRLGPQVLSSSYEEIILNQASCCSQVLPQIIAQEIHGALTKATGVMMAVRYLIRDLTAFLGACGVAW